MKITLSDISQALEPYGWSVVSQEYVNLDTEMEFKCAEGHKVISTWKKLRNKIECPICQNNKLKAPSIAAKPKKKGVYRVLALDQATYLTGWSIYDNKQLITYGLFSSTGEEFINRANDIKEWLYSMISNWQPDRVALEGIQYQAQAGVTTFETLARLQGILMECCYELGVPFTICHTATWRTHCGVKGKTRIDKKKNMQKIVKDWFDVTVSEDEADAVGIGKYCSDTTYKQIEIEDWE